MLYLLHSTAPVGSNGRNSARHYLGWAPEGKLAQRLAQHRSGRGASITKAFLGAGGTLFLALTVQPGTRTQERQLKSWGHLDHLCPVCHPELPLLGHPVSMERLCLLRAQSLAQSRRRRKDNGGGWSAGRPTGSATSCPPEQSQDRATG